MADVNVSIKGVKCNRCGYEWVPRFGINKLPQLCPKCRSAYWNKPRVRFRRKEDVELTKRLREHKTSIKKIVRELNPVRQAIRADGDVKDIIKKSREEGRGREKLQKGKKKDKGKRKTDHVSLN